MILEDLVKCSAFQLESLTDEELLVILKPFFTVTRPELVKHSTPKTQAHIPSRNMDKLRELALADPDFDLTLITGGMRKKKR